MNHSNEAIIFTTQKNTGIILLNNPGKLNVVNDQMIMPLIHQLQYWAGDEKIHNIIIHSAGDKAFCAGGDVAKMALQIKAGIDFAREFLYPEYQMNCLIHEYKKPIIPLMAGIVMGGGVGVGGHCSHRVAFANTKIAMPECAIGFVPDVGGSYLLKNAPNFWGFLMGLTSDTISGTDAIYAGFADYYADNMDKNDIIKAVVDNGLTGLDRLPLAKKTTQNPEIDRIAPLFNQSDFRVIMDNLAKDKSETARHYWGKMEKNSHLAKAITLRHLHDIKNDTIRQTITKEYRLAHKLAHSNEFYEGVRALLLDKDKNPQWSKDFTNIDAYFAPLAEEIVFL